jgi:pantothenate synthetase
MLKQIESTSDFKVDYIEFFHPQNLQPVTRVDVQCRVAIAARLGSVRLIDNASLANSEI